MHPQLPPLRARSAGPGVAAACLLTALLMLCAHGGSAAEDASAVPAATVAAAASRTLDEALADLAASLRDLPARRSGCVIGCGRPERLLDGYAAETLAALLGGASGPARRMNGLAPGTDDPFGPALPPCLLRSLRLQGTTVFVRIGTSLRDQQRLLSSAVYDVASGTRLSAVSTPFHLPAELELLVTAEPEPLSAQDREWLVLVDELFPAPDAVPAPGTRQAVRLAQAQYFFGTGLWSEAARRFTELAAGAPNRLFARAVLAGQLAGDGTGAQALLQSALNVRPDSGPLYALNAWLSLRQDRPSDALMWLAQARLSDMAREGLYTYARGLIALERADQATAEQALTAAADLLPDKLFAQRQAARFYWRRADLQKALNYHRRATRTSGATAETWAELAMVLDASHDLDGAVAALRQAFRMRSDNPVITRQLAALLKRQGHFEDSLTVLQRAKDAHPCNAALLAAYGDGAAEMWKIAEAEAAYRAAIATGSHFPYAAARLAAMLRVQRRYGEAQAVLMDLLATEPDYQPARLELGRILGETERIEEATSTLAEVARNPQYEVAAKLAQAQLNLDNEQPDEAVRNAQIAVSLRPDAQSYALLSEAFLSSGDADKALATARTALEKGADSAPAHLAMARALEANGQTQEALRETETALKLNPYSVDALSLSGTLRQKLGEFRECAALWQRALSLNPWHADLHYRLAELLGKTLRDSEGALEHYNRYFELEKLRTGAG